MSLLGQALLDRRYSEDVLRPTADQMRSFLGLASCSAKGTFCNSDIGYYTGQF